MSRWMVVFAASLVSACGGGTARTCAESCPQGSRCDPMTNLCVRDEGTAGGMAGAGGGSEGGGAAGGSTAGGHAGGTAGGSTAGGDASGTAGGSTAGGDAGGTAGGSTAGGDAGGAAGGSTAGGEAGGAAGGSTAGGAAGGVVVIPAPVFSLTTPAPGVATAGPSTELVGAIMQAPGREVTSATIDVGDGTPRAITLAGASWRVTVPLAQSIEASRTFTITALDASSQTSQSTVQVTIDTLGPRLAMTQPAVGTVVGAMATLVGTATDPSTPVMVVTVDTGAGPRMAQLGPAGNWQVSVTFPPNLNREPHAVTVSATDSLGNVSSQTFQVLVDTQGPTLALTSPAPMTAVGSPASLAGTATDPSGGVTVTLDVGAGPQAVVVQGNGAWTTMASFPPNLDRVLRSVVLRGTDSLGNVTQVTAQVLVDTAGPVLAFTSPAAGERLGVPRTQPVSGTVTDGSGVASVSMNCADLGGARPASLTPGAWSVSWPLPAADYVSFVCSATGTDTLGNVTTVTRSYFVDTVGPVVTFVAPAVGALLGGPMQSTVRVEVSVTDGSGQLGAVSSVFPPTTVAATRSGAVYVATHALPALDFQLVNATVTASDAEGNSTVAVRSTTVDTVAPVVAVTSPTMGQVFNVASFSGTNNVAVTWTMSDGDPATTQRFNGAVVGTSTRTAQIATSASDNGVVYANTLVATDTAGNVGTTMRSFTVDRVAPSVLAMAPTDGSRMNDPRVASVTFSEPMNVSVHGLTGVGGGSWNGLQTTWSSNALAGSTVFTPALNLGVRDLAGNPPTTSPSWRFHTAPVLPPSGVLLAGGVVEFDAVSDVDGQVFIATTTDGGEISSLTLNGADGGFTINESSLALAGATYSSVHVSVHSEALPTLAVRRTRAITAPRTSFPAAVLSKLSVDDAAAVDPMFLPVVSPPIEAADGTALIGSIVGVSYSRGIQTGEMLAAFAEKVIPSGRQWAAFSYAGGALHVSHRLCGTDLGGSRRCGFTEGTVSDAVLASVVASVSGAVSNSGCFIYSYDAASGRRARIFGAPSTFVGSSSGNSLTSVAAPGARFTVARRNAGGHYGAWEAGPNTVQVARTTTPTTCTSGSLSTNWTMLGTVSVPMGSKLRVVELGTRPAVLYLDGTLLYLVYP